jgi:hypothetical protein
MEESIFLNLLDISVLLSKYTVKEEDIPSRISQHIFENGLPFTNCINVKKSNIHGNGVFAINEIEPNKVVGIYQCNGIIKNEQLLYYGEQEPIKYNDYKIKLMDNEDTFIFGNPHIYSDYSSGHLLNDSYMEIEYFQNLTDENIDINEFGKNVVRYMLNRNDNCVLVQTKYCVYVKTLKTINANEELLASYGFQYWCKNFTAEHTCVLLTKYMSNLSINQNKFTINLIYNLAKMQTNS